MAAVVLGVHEVGAERAPIVETAPSGGDGSGASESSTATRSSSAIAFETATGSSPQHALPLAGRTVAIDPGHNGGNFRHPLEINRLVDAGTLRKPCDTTGTSTAAGYTEAEYNLDVSRRLARRLRRDGARVVLTRTGNTGWGPCITRRAAIGNAARADAAVSIHADGGPHSGRGFHVIYPLRIRRLTDDIVVDSRRLAIVIRRDFRRGTGMPLATYVGRNGLAARGDLGGLNLSDVPKVFVETGNMRNAQDARLLSDPRFRERAAAALQRGLIRFLLAR